MGKLKTIEYEDSAREKLLSGVSIIAKAVKVTLGPSGKNVLIRRKNEKPFATKDGVTVAMEVASDDHIEQMAIEAVQEVAVNSDNSAGDGTTTATVLTEKIFSLGSEHQTGNINFLDLKRGIDKGVEFIVDQLKNLAVECKDPEALKNVAMISSNNDEEISSIVVDAYKVAGKQGVVNIKRSRTSDTYLTTIEGMNLPTGYASVYFVTDQGNDIVELDKPYIYSTNEKITMVTENLNNLLKIINNKQQSLLIICKDIDPSVLGMLVDNKVNGSLKVCVCKAPEFGQEQINLLEDLGVMLGKTPFIENGGFDFNKIDVPINHKLNYPENDDDLLSYLPQSESVLVTKDRLSVKGPIVSEEDSLKIDEAKLARADYIRSKITRETNEYEKGLMQTRISRLTDGIAYINIGAVSEMEYIEKQHRIQDALYAVKSASEEGIVPGGGTTLLYISKMYVELENDSERVGAAVVFEAIKAPFFQILENVGMNLSEDTIEYYTQNFNQGVNARNKKFCKDMIKEGIIDPVKVTRVALQNAASVAGMLLTTDCVIVENDAYNKPLKNYGEA